MDYTPNVYDLNPMTFSALYSICGTLTYSLRMSSGTLDSLTYSRSSLRLSVNSSNYTKCETIENLHWIGAYSNWP